MENIYLSVICLRRLEILSITDKPGDADLRNLCVVLLALF